MYLNPNEIEKANRKRETIKKHFMNEVKPCNQCGGTGLEGLSRTSDGDTMWDSASYCAKCKGIGFIKWKETILQKLCYKCDGTGKNESFGTCEYCKGEGVLDWIQYMRIGRKK